MILRPYQIDVSNQIDAAWSCGAQNVCAVLPTGAGKTMIFGEKLAVEPGVRFAIAHRQELIGQISMSLARYGIVHNIVAPSKIIKWIVTQQTRIFGRHYYHGQARCIVTGVLTLLNRQRQLSNALSAAKLWVIDEGHHCLRDNVWGKAAALFPATARGLLVTATPERADGRGIGRHADGIVDEMVVGPAMRSLIHAGYLTDYRIFGPYTNINMSAVPVSKKTGDYTKPKLVEAVRKSRIVGDVVASYIKIAGGKIGVTFVPDVQTGEDIAAAYTAAGVPARVIHSKTPDRERQESTEMLSRGDLKQLVNVDIFGEGYDLPAIEVISKARPTESFPLYSQQFGRVLRIMEGKTVAYIIDHVRNVERHRLPDAPREWSLDSRDSKRSKRDTDLIPIRTCRKCTAVYESWNRNCPYCGHIYAAEACGSIEQVEGDITELTPETLSAMRGEVSRVDASDEDFRRGLERAGMTDIAVAGAVAQHRKRRVAQETLRGAISEWAGYQTAAGQLDRDILRRFYSTYGMDVLAAQALGRREAEGLTNQIKESIK